MTNEEILCKLHFLHNSIDVTAFDNLMLRIDCNKAEEGLNTTLNS